MLSIRPTNKATSMPAPNHPRQAPPSPFVPVHVASHLRRFLFASLGESSCRPIVTLLDSGTALVCICIVLVSAVPIPLKCVGVVLLQHNPVNRLTAPVLPVQQLPAPQPTLAKIRPPLSS